MTRRTRMAVDISPRACCMCLLGAVAWLVPLIFGTVVVAAQESEYRQIVVFGSSSCARCQELKQHYFRQLSHTYPSLFVLYYDLDHEGTYDILLDMQAELGGPEAAPMGEELPIVVVGRTILSGEAQIREQLPALLEDADVPPEADGDLTGAAEIPRQPGSSEGSRPVHLAYLYEPGCAACNTVEYALAHLQQQYPFLEVEELSLAVPENRILQEEMGARLGIPPEERHLAPAIYVGEEYFIGDISLAAVRRAVRDYQVQGTSPWWRKLPRRATDEAVGRYLKQLQLPAVMTAGLIDGINPCAFSIVIFLVSYLSCLKRRRQEILHMGILFIAAVFASYFCIGMGLLEFFRRASVFPWIRKAIFFGGVAFTASLGVLSVIDFVRIRGGGSARMVLKIPGRLRHSVNTLIGKKVRRPRYLIPLALGIGFLASSVEFVCTGQIYLPTLIFLSGVAQARKALLVPLAVYNLSFVLPLVGVFVAVYAGVSSGVVARVSRHNFPLAKLLAAGLFFGLSALLLMLM